MLGQLIWLIPVQVERYAQAGSRQIAKEVAMGIRVVGTHVTLGAVSLDEHPSQAPTASRVQDIGPLRHQMSKRNDKSAPEFGVDEFADDPDLEKVGHSFSHELLGETMSALGAPV